MGFLDSVEKERNRQRNIEAELNRREEALKQNVKPTEVLASKVVLSPEEEDAIIAELLDNLEQFGYLDYLHKIDGGLGYSRRSVFYADHLEHRGNLVTAQKVGIISLFPFLYRTDDGHLSEKKFRDRWDMALWNNYEKNFLNTQTQYFGDLQPRTDLWSRFLNFTQPTIFVEPEEVGIGLRFSKVTSVRRKKVWINAPFSLEGPLGHTGTELTLRCAAFYVRFRSPQMAILTGSNLQKEINLSDLNTFDQVLEQVAKHPIFPAYTTIRNV